MARREASPGDGSLGANLPRNSPLKQFEVNRYYTNAYECLRM